MRSVVVGLGNQGKKRMTVAGHDVVATIDPLVSHAHYKSIEQVSLDAFDAALVCTPDPAKVDILGYLLSHGKHVLVEKPLLASDKEQIFRLSEIAQKNRVACYTAYNHRFEPHIVNLKALLDRQALGEIYVVKIFYGNGTAREVRESNWRDHGLGVLSDIGSHLLDMVLFLFGQQDREFAVWQFGSSENLACDNVLFGSSGPPAIELGATLLSWRNTFTVDIYCAEGSAHISCLCKWGPSTLTIRKRVLPSGIPEEEEETISCSDPTWSLEYDHFKDLCRKGGTNLENDIWICSVFQEMAQSVNEDDIL